MLLTLDEAIMDREGQFVEFKNSRAEAPAAAQALVAFANAGGGQVFVGVTDNREKRGIDRGAQSHEHLVRDLDAHIYPSLPLELTGFPLTDDREVLRVWVPADRPPIVGAYLYSSTPLGPDDRVALDSSQAFRRVGRSSRKIDFMWLRGGLPDDPILVIDPVEGARIEHRQIALPWAVQHVTGGVAYDITVTTDPRVGNEIATTRDIPGRHERR